MSLVRRSVLAAAGPALVPAASLPGASSSPNSAEAATDRDVADLVDRASRAHEALMRGDVDRYLSLIAQTGDFTLMSPFGGKPTREPERSRERWEAIGRFFRNGRDSTLEVVRAYRSVDMVVIAAIERAHVEVGGLPGQDWSLRVTLVFRKESGQWLLAHRHADGLAGGIGVAEAALLARRSTAT